MATHRLYVGMIYGAVIWRLAGYDIIPYIPKTTHLTPKQREHNDIYLQMLRKTLDTNHFYFSYYYDMTHSQQRLYSMSYEERNRSLFDRADTRFVWNGALLNNFNCSEMRNFQLPLILGCKYSLGRITHFLRFYFNKLYPLFSRFDQPSPNKWSNILLVHHFQKVCA